MSPTNQTQVGDYKIEEFYWAGGYVVYVNNRAVTESFDEAVELAKKGEYEV